MVYKETSLIFTKKKPSKELLLRRHAFGFLDLHRRASYGRIRSAVTEETNEKRSQRQDIQSIPGSTTINGLV